VTALVTGCAGFVGSHLTESLLNDGIPVLGIDCFNDNYARAQKLRNLERARDWDAFDFVPVDLARGNLEELLLECDVVFHLAAEPGVRQSWGSRFATYVRNNVEATQLLLEAACAHPGVRFVFASSSSVYGQAERFPTSEDTVPMPASPYGVTKLAAEHLCHAYRANHAIETVSLRFFSVYGPRQRPDMAFARFCDAVLDDRSISVLGDGRQTRDFTFVADVVRATRAAASIPSLGGGPYNIGGGSRVSLMDAVGILESVVGQRIAVEHRDPEAGDVHDTAADTALAARELRFRPQTTLAEGLALQFQSAVLERAVRESATLTG